MVDALNHEPKGVSSTRMRRLGLIVVLVFAALAATAFNGQTTSGSHHHPVKPNTPSSPTVTPRPSSPSPPLSEKHNDGKKTKIDAETSVPMLTQPWGYAKERNEMRWKLIFASLASTWVPTSPDDPDPPLDGRDLIAVDYGADQGYFTVSMARFIGGLLPHQPTSSGSSGTVPSNISILAVEKGGVGGSLWEKEKKGNSVLDILRKRAASHLSNNGSMDDARGKPVEHPLGKVNICPTTLTTSHFPQLRAAGCRFDVQFVLSMLHWVEGIDGRSAFNSNVCSLIGLSRTTFFELPHPAAKRTYGDKRYRGWYNKRTNLTEILEEAADQCACHSSEHSSDGGDTQPCRYVVTLVGVTPWGRNLSRDIHRIDRVFHNKAHGGDGEVAESSSSMGLAPRVERKRRRYARRFGACSTLLHCRPLEKRG